MTLRGRSTPVATLVIALLAALLQTACPGGAELDDADSFLGVGGMASGGGPGAGGSAAECDVPDILNKACGSAICHGTPGDTTTVPLGNVNLLAPGVEGRIYNVDASYNNISSQFSSDCPTPPEKLLDPTSLQTSLMYTKINGGHACGAPMPSIGDLTPDRIACYNAWLEGILASPPTN